MKSLKLTLFALLIAVSFIHAQQPTQTIRGVVTDKASNVPIPSVSVIIPGSSPFLGTKTDSLGNFILKNVPIGRCNIQASMLGYEPFLVQEIQVSSAKEIFLTITLQEKTTALSELIVKPKTNKSQPLNPTALVSAKMLSVEEAKRYAGGFDDPARLVSSFAGVSSNVGNNAIVVRGNNPQALQWKMEGVEIPNPNHFADMSSFGGGGLTALSSQLLANSDFFLGAFPGEYGNALSGVFDIFMRTGNNQKREHTLQLGLIGIDASSEGPFKKGNRSSYLFNYRYSTMSLLEPLLPDNAGGVRYQDLSFKLNFPTKKAGTFSVWGIGLIDASGADAKKDLNEWKYDADSDNQDVKQYMVASGIGHKIMLNQKQFLKSTLAATVNGLDMTTDRLDKTLISSPKNKIDNQNWNFVLSSFLNTKFSASHTNKTGFVATGLMYRILLKNAERNGDALQTVANEDGFSTLLSAYSNSTINLNDRLMASMGVNTQVFTLNNNFTIEPRISLKYQFQPTQSISLAYGLHSRLERLNYYFAKNSLYGTDAINKNLDFTKAHHLVAGYDINFTDLLHLKIETYYQQLFSVPVVENTSFSLINMQNDWFFSDKLQNTGKGRNYGIDVSFEKYLSQGYYYMLTASWFNSEYASGDKIWRNTRYNRNYTLNFLIGKEWQLGRNKQNVLSANARLSYQGGDRYSPVNQQASVATEDVVFDESNAFSKQFSPALTSHFTIAYTMNKKKTAHEIAFKMINTTMHKEFASFEYNYITKTVDERRKAIFIPNLSYKIEF